MKCIGVSSKPCPGFAEVGGKALACLIVWHATIGGNGNFINETIILYPPVLIKN